MTIPETFSIGVVVVAFTIGLALGGALGGLLLQRRK